MSASWVNNTAILFKAHRSKQYQCQAISSAIHHSTPSKATRLPLIIAQLAICRISCINLNQIYPAPSISKTFTGIVVSKTFQITLFPKRQRDHNCNRHLSVQMKIPGLSQIRPTVSSSQTHPRYDSSPNNHALWIILSQWLMCRSLDILKPTHRANLQVKIIFWMTLSG